MNMEDLRHIFDAAVSRSKATNREDIPDEAHRDAGLKAVVEALWKETADRGHGHLRGENWVTNPCQICRAEAAEAEVVRLRAILNAAEKDCHKARFALQTIGESTVPDQPASSGLSELEHVQHHHTQLRRLAIMTLQPEAIGIYEAPRRDADEIRVRGVGRDLFEPRSIRVALTERPTDDEIRSMHDWMRGWKL